MIPGHVVLCGEAVGDACWRLNKNNKNGHIVGCLLDLEARLKRGASPLVVRVALNRVDALAEAAEGRKATTDVHHHVHH